MKHGKLECIAMTAWLLPGLAMQILGPLAFAQTKPAVELEAAITKEQVDGDLDTAIAAYRKIAANTSASRDIRASALLHLARCYEKLGREARNVYLQIVRDFPDQPAAAQARARLAALNQDGHPTAMTQRKIDLPGPGLGPGDTDGRRVVYWNSAAGELIFGDLAGKSKRVIVTAKPDDPPGSFPSRDFSIVGLFLYPKAGRPFTLAVVNIDGSGYRDIVRMDGRPACGTKWSWDNRYLLCVQSHDATNRLLRISVPDGKIRELLNLQTAMLGTATYSPDGRFIAYQILPPSAADPVSRIFLLPAEGGDPQLVYEERSTNVASPSLRLIDWTADGGYLAIGSERTGKPGLHLLPIKDGKSAGEPIFLIFGNFERGVTTTAGDLVYASVKPGGEWAVHLASLDSNSRVGAWKRLDLHLGKNGHPFPNWSSDSERIVYTASSEEGGQAERWTVHVHNILTGEDREIHRGDADCKWAAQQPKLFCGDESGIFSIAAGTGEFARLQPFTKRWRIASASRDDGALYMFTPFGQGMEMMRWDIAARQETMLERNPSHASAWLAQVSPDERSLLRHDPRGLAIRPILGGDWRLLISMGKDASATATSFGHYGFTPDGKWILYHDTDSAEKHSLFRIPAAGGKPERLGDFPGAGFSGNLEISPDGHKILATVGEYATSLEIWKLENFVPSRKTPTEPRP